MYKEVLGSNCFALFKFIKVYLRMFVLKSVFFGNDLSVYGVSKNIGYYGDWRFWV